MFRRRYAAFVGLALIWLAQTCGAHYVDLDRDLVKKGTLVFGVALTGPPFAYRRDGDLLGFEIAVARQVARAHGLKLEVTQLPRPGLAGALAAGDVDAINTFALEGDVEGMTSVPYLVVGDHMLVLRGNPFRIHAVSDLAGRTVAVTSGTTAEGFAAVINENLSRAGKRPMNVHSFPDQRFTHFPVSMGHAVAYFLPTVSAVAVTQDPEARTRLVEGVFAPRNEVGFGIHADHEQIHHALEHAIAAMVATGKYEQLRTEYSLPVGLSPFR